MGERGAARSLIRLPLELRLPFLIGQVCLADVSLERALASAYATLADTSKQMIALLEEMPDRFGKLLDACKDLLRQRADLSHGQREAVRGALVAAIAAHRERDRVVHDIWARKVDAEDGQEVADAEPVWHRIQSLGFMREKATAATLGDIEQVRHELLRCWVRIVSIPLAMGYFGREEQWDTVEGKFDLLRDGSYRLHRWRPPSE